jgi:hypothetical protein
MARTRACDACSLRKVRCTGQQPCPNCIGAGFQCSFPKRTQKPGPKGPRGSTRARVNQQSGGEGDSSTARASLSPPSPGETHTWSTAAFPQLPSASPSPSPAEWEMAFTLADILCFLKTYDERMYPVWPVINTERIIAAFRHDWDNPELCALVFAVCAGTGAQLQFNSYAQEWSAVRTPRGNDSMALEDRFAVEAERYRSKYDYRESTTTEAILVPLFLHFYYGAKGKKQTTSFPTTRSCHALPTDGARQGRDVPGPEPGGRELSAQNLLASICDGKRTRHAAGNTHLSRKNN